MKPVAVAAILSVVTAAMVSSCGTDRSPAVAQKADDCIVRLHGKGDTGSPTVVSNGIADVRPTGNADGWGKRQWVYFPDERYAAARDVVKVAADASGCRRVVIDGFSNGASFAASMVCRGETLDGRIVGVVIDDPVTDSSTEHCSRPPSIEVALYSTGALDAQAPVGTQCSVIDWTCEGGVIVGIDTYASRLGVTIQHSPSTTHEWYRTAPELTAWLTHT